MTETALDPETLAAFGFGPDAVGQLIRYVQATEVRRSHGPCVQPIRLTGSRTLVHAVTGEVLHEFTSDDLPGGAITVPCGNRRESACPSCSGLYKYDAYNLVVAGLRGGKDVTSAVGEHPRLFVTVTAPSFGPVHLGPDKDGKLRLCRPRRSGLSCGRWHGADDPLIGTPLDPDTYDYERHVLFNAVASALWSQTTVEIRRALAEVVGLSRRSCERVARVEFAKVAEYQARGVVHFHAVVRLDGAAGPSSPLPSWASFDVLEEAVCRGVARVSLTGSEQLVGVVEPVVWGSQVDVRRVLSGELADGLSDVAVARYVAKYATKAAEASGVDLPRLYCGSCFGSGRPRGAAAGRVLTVCPACHGAGTKLDFAQFNLSDHARRLVDTCWRLGGRDEFADLKLRKWTAHARVPRSLRDQESHVLNHIHRPAAGTCGLRCEHS